MKTRIALIYPFSKSIVGVQLIYYSCFFFSIIFSQNIFSQETSQQDNFSQNKTIQDTIVFDGKRLKNCYDAMFLFRDTNQLSIEEVGHKSFQDNFRKYHEDEYLEKGETYWMRITLKNEYDPYEFQDRFYFSIRHITNTSEVYILNPTTNKYIKKVGGDASFFNEKRQTGIYFLFIQVSAVEMPIVDTENLTYFIKIKSWKKIQLTEIKKKIKYISLEYLQSLNSGFHFQVLLYMGFLIMIFIYSLGLFSFMQEAAFFYYSLYCFSLLFYTIHSFEYSYFLLSKIPLIGRYYYGIFFYFIYIVLFSFLFFISNYLELHENHPTWDKVFKSIGYLCLVVMVIEIYKFYIDPTFLSPILQGVYVDLFYVLILVVIVVLAFMRTLLKLQIKRKYFLFFGILSLLLGVVYVIVMYFYHNSKVGSYYMVFMYFSALEIILFGLGLAYRIKENEIDKRQTILQLQASENKQKIIEIERKNLQEINQIKNKLYTNITHEFRTPLTVIQGMAQQINGKYEKETRLIRRNSQNLLHLINQMLDLSKLESGNLALQNIQGNIITFLKNETESYVALATSNDIIFKIQTSSDEINMDFDLQKMRQIIANLLSNAIKFLGEKENGEIIMEVKEVRELNIRQLELKISDNGIGIPSEQLQNIFDRFYQVDNSMTRQREGTGIGLALTKELVELMSGKISVESQIDKGTTFTIRLPITQKAILTKIEEDENVLQQFFDKKNDANTFSINQIFDNSDNPTALIIEDNEDVIQYLISCLQDDYRVLTALNGKEGIQTAIKNTPDIIISDVMMPEADGFEVVNQLKNDERTSHIPIILLTAKADHESKLEGLEKGADAYLTKPFDQQELMIRLGQLIVIRKKLQERYSSPELVLSTDEEQLSKEDLFLKKLRTQLEKQLGNSEYGIQILANDMNLSRQQLYRKTKALTGKSIAAYFRSLRLHHGKKLLQSSNLNISEVAYRVGFSDPSYFSKSYSEEFGYAPKKEQE